MRTGASAVCSSFGAGNSSRDADPSQISEIERSRLRARASSWTAGSSCWPAASRGKWRTLTSAGSLCVGPGLGDALERHSSLRQTAVVRRERSAEDRASAHAGVRGAVEPVGTRHPDRAELLREALDPAAGEREVPVDPDVRARRHVLTGEHRIDDEEELLVLATGRVEQLLAGIRARLPVDEERRGAAGILP